MGLDQVKKLLYVKGNNYYIEETVYRMGEESVPASHQIRN
jgi:hypothetical protein